MLNTVVLILETVILAALILCFSYQGIFFFAPYVKQIAHRGTTVEGMKLI